MLGPHAAWNSAQFCTEIKLVSRFLKFTLSRAASLDKLLCLFVRRSLTCSSTPVIRASLGLLLEATVSYLASDTLVNSKLLPVEHCVKGNHEAKGLSVGDIIV